MTKFEQKTAFCCLALFNRAACPSVGYFMAFSFHIPSGIWVNLRKADENPIRE
jgi:hypothetical protein